MQGERIDGLDAAKGAPKLNRQSSQVLNAAEARTAYLLDPCHGRAGHRFNISLAVSSIVKNPATPLTSIKYRTFSLRPDSVSCVPCSFVATRISRRVASPEVSMKGTPARSTVRLRHLPLVQTVRAVLRRSGEVFMSSLPASLISTSLSCFRRSISIGARRGGGITPGPICPDSLD